MSLEKCIVHNISTGETIETDIEIEMPDINKINAEARKVEISNRLLEIDSESIRALRAFYNNTQTDYDKEKLSNLETEATELRKEFEEISLLLTKEDLEAVTE